MPVARPCRRDPGLEVAVTAGTSWLSEKAIEQLLPAHVEMPGGYVSEHGSQDTDPERSVARNRHVVLTSGFGGEPHGAPRLTGNSVPEDSKGLCQICPERLRGFLKRRGFPGEQSAASSIAAVRLHRRGTLSRRARSRLRQLRHPPP